LGYQDATTVSNPATLTGRRRRLGFFNSTTPLDKVIVPNVPEPTTRWMRAAARPTPSPLPWR
jgi:hypothetical protein